MDLSDFDVRDRAAEGAWLHLESPQGEKLYVDDKDRTRPMRIHLLGNDSDLARTTRHKIQNARMKTISRRGRMVSLTAEKQDEEGIALLAKLTLGWENLVMGGEELEFSTGAAKKLYADLPWVREQVDDFIDDRTNYLGEASASS